MNHRINETASKIMKRKSVYERKTSDKARTPKIRTRMFTPTGLSTQHEAFCQSFVEDLNGTLAYYKAYPNIKRTSAAASASQLLTNVKIQVRIKELTAERNKRLQVSRERIIRELAVTAFNVPQNIGAKHTDKNKALELLGRTEGMFDDKLNVGFDASGLQIRLEISAKEAPEPLPLAGNDDDATDHSR